MIDEIGPATQEGTVRVPGEHCDGAGRVTRAFVTERIHRATSAIAGTMLAYAAHRQRLPLMRSRISSSSRVVWSAFRSAVTALGQPASASRSIPTAEQICPGVQ